MDLGKIRLQIDEINAQMLALFEKRMALCGEVALYKAENQMEVFAPAREAAILEWVGNTADPGLKAYAKAYFNAMLQLSRDYQNYLLGRPDEGTALVTGEEMKDTLDTAVMDMVEDAEALLTETSAELDALTDRIEAILKEEQPE
ncbi:MAG: chorismate mutase [Oscillospiraceae bacterium]|nr:chorismate mutase [Oscillospiraceae bacterium]